jgi:DNA helicase II / ATP-dependent DNA helicase PcrA
MLIDALNDRQQEAVAYHDGPLLVVAGPGTGKTRVLTAKVEHLLRSGRTSPERILAMTFTEKAAAEMARRVRSDLSDLELRRFPLVDTFHGFCFQLVKEFADRLGFRDQPRLLTGPLYIRYLLDLLDDVFVTDHTDLVRRSLRFAETLADFVSRCHDEAIIDRDLVAEVDQWLASAGDAAEPNAVAVRDLAESLPKLLARQYADGIVTYGDLLSLAVRLCRDHLDVLHSLQGRFDYVLVDELQDNNTAQFHLVNALAAEHHHIAAVGDEDQCIYRFRGAGLGLVERFRKHWEERAGLWDPKSRPKGLRAVTLVDNYRSTPAIVNVCQSLIQHDLRRDASKSLRAANRSETAQRNTVPLVRCSTEEHERDYLVHNIMERLRAGSSPGDLAILCRSLNHISTLVAELRRQGVAVEVVGETGMFADAVVREILAWLRTLYDPVNEEAALHRVLRMQSFGLSLADQRSLAEAAKSAKLPLMNFIEQLVESCAAATDSRTSTTLNHGISPDGLKQIAGLHRVYQRLQSEADIATTPDVTGIINELLDFTGVQHRLRDDSAHGRRHQAAVQGLLAAAEQYQANYPRPTLGGFLEFAELMEDIGHDDTAGEPSDRGDSVKVMTVHQAKGREFPVVFVAGLMDRFPSGNRREQHRKFLDHLTLRGADVDAIHLEEERRVLFVALSRAEQELLLSLYEQKNGKPISRPSPFIEELASAKALEIVRASESADSGGVPHAPGQAEIRVNCKIEPTGGGRLAAEARLFHLVSRAGAGSRDLAGRQRALAEAIHLCAELLTEETPDAQESARQMLGDLRIAVQPEPQSRNSADNASHASARPLALSAPALETCSDCPRRYYYRYVLAIADPVGPRGPLAWVVRTAVKRYLSKRPRPTPENQDELFGMFEDDLSAMQFASRKEREQAQARGQEILAQFLREEAACAADIERVEVDKPFEVRFADDVILHGQWDRMDELTDGRVRIIDYRAGAVGSRPEYLRGYRVPLYAWAAGQVTGRPLAAVEVVGLRELVETKTKGAHLERQTLPWEDGSKYALTEKRLEELQTEIASVVRVIRTGNFEPKPDAERCGQCGYRLLCDAAWGTNDRSEQGL